jgi:ribosomal protein S18 acetylase RimI-like enzyme
VDGKGMRTVEPSGVRSLNTTASHNALSPGARILRDTILVSIGTSPGAFLATAVQIKKEPPAFWEGELTSSTWAVVKYRNKIVGIAAAKSPGEMDSYALQGEACFIESVWVAPRIRGNGVGERLVTYLIEQKRKAGIRKFYLWVFDHNTPAIKLYRRMNFKPTGYPPALVDLPEIQYLREFDSDVIDDEELGCNAAARKLDRRRFRITYHMLTSQPDWESIHWALRLRPFGLRR